MKSRRRRKVVLERLGTGVFPCYMRKGFINTAGRFQACKKLPSMASLTHADLIVGGTLCRYVLLEPLPRQQATAVFVDALRLTPTARSMRINCDGCANRHRATNVNCSAAVASGVRRFAAGVAYRLGTATPVGAASEMAVTESSSAASSVRRVTLRLVLYGSGAPQR